MSNDPRFNGGSMDIAAGEKMLRLLELCETFHLPLAYFADEPGFSVGPAQERLGIVRAGARVVTALNSSRTPYICFVVRQLYGVAGGLHWRGQGFYRRYAWPLGARRLDAHPGRHRDRLQARDRGRRGPGGEAGRDPKSACSPSHRPSATPTPSASRRSSIPRDTRPLLVDFVRDARRIVAAEMLGPATGPSYRP